ncbi:DUF1254 domain-containing protein [Paraburkholderia sacchari]|uniref:DUF1254 domain-containing protein n=1 Tax=Paraburkholderia sacchari TaxID=159450 RepID=UPI0039A6191E
MSDKEALMNTLSKPTACAVDARTAHEIGIEAYTYLYPLVTMEVTRRIAVNSDEARKPGLGRAGMFHHLRSYPSVDFREVVRPNFDTLYSVAWFNVAKDPWIVSVPDTAGRYYVLPIYDMWSDVFAAPGSRTTGTQEGHFAIVAKGWCGTLPDGVQRIEAPTETCWIIVRTQTNGPADYAAVHAVQDGFRLTPLSRWGEPYVAREATIDPTVDTRTPPLDQVNAMSAAQFFALAAEILQREATHAADWTILARLQRIGFVPGQSFNLDSAPEVVRAALQAVPQEARKQMLAKVPTMGRVANGWLMNTDNMGVYGNYYLKRAIVAMVGLGAISPEDAVYPMNVVATDGKPMTGDKHYVMHFAREALPPADAFWSITMYDAEGFQVANPINRYAIGDRDPLRYNADGSLDIYIQHENPGTEREANWLPAPMGQLGLTMRVYAPRPEALDGRWAPPAVQLVGAQPD